VTQDKQRDAAMMDFSSVSSDELAQRRRQLQRQRRSRFLQRSWQILAVSGLTVGVVWLTTLPDWMIRSPNQIVIEGNQSFSSDMLRAMLAIRYPQSILALQPEAIAAQLEAEAPVSQVVVTRRMFPPRLTIQLQERYPVAVAYTSPPTAVSPGQPSDHLAAVGLLDEKGTWIPYEKYVSLNQSRQLPTLKVIGFQESYSSQWVSLYLAVSRSPVKISEIDWREPGNLILQTELGIIHCGPYGERFPEQLRVLDQMRRLPDSISADEIAYIDLSDPEVPMLELTSGTREEPPSP
jgi:cell division protein FtsQ